jgi:ABC-type molybdate transport system substrate-binding protein
MQAAVTSCTESRDAAQQFVDFLASAEGGEVFGGLGYLTGGEQMAEYRR